MRTARTLSWVMLLTIGSLILVSCSLRWLARTSWEPPRVVAVEGADAWGIGPQNEGAVYCPVKKGQPTHLLLRDGDIVFRLESDRFLYRYNDGESLSIGGDKYRTRTELKGKTVALRPIHDKDWEWVEKAQPEELSALRLVNIEGAIFDRWSESLKRLSRVNPNVGLAINDEWTLQHVLPMFDPEVLVFLPFGGRMDTPAAISAALSKKHSFRKLYIDGRMDMSFLSGMPNLDTLFIDKWNPSIPSPVPENLHNLRRLILARSETVNLALLGKQFHLDELRFEEKCMLESLEGLSNFPEIKELALGPCEKLNDLSPLKQLKHLKWLGLPLTTTQEQLEDLVRDHPDLVGLELFKADKVTDLSVLKKLRSLKYLLVCMPNANLDPLLTMRGLRWLAVGVEEQDEGILVKIQQALPETSVVRVIPLCLGSGWILLLAPGVLLARCVKKRRRYPALRCDAGQGKRDEAACS